MGRSCRLALFLNSRGFSVRLLVSFLSQRIKFQKKDHTALVGCGRGGENVGAGGGLPGILVLKHVTKDLVFFVFMPLIKISLISSQFYLYSLHSPGLENSVL